MALTRTMKLGEVDMLADATVSAPTPGKGCLLRTLSSQGRGEGTMQWTKTPNEKVTMRCSLSLPAEAARGRRPYLKQSLRLDASDASPSAKPPRNGSRTREIVVRESDLRKYGHDLRKLSECQVMPLSPSVASGSKKDFDLSFKSAFALRCRGGAELRDPWQGLKNPEFSREQSEQDLVLNQVWVNAMQPRKKLYDLTVAEGGEGGALSPPPGGALRPGDASPSAPLPPPAPISGGAVPTATRRRSSRRRAALDQGDKVAPGVGILDERPWSRESARVSRRSSSARSSDQKMKKTNSTVESRIKNIEEVFGNEDEEEAGVGSMAVRAATKMQKGNMRKISDRLYYDENPRAAWLAVSAETGDVTFYHQSVAQRLEAAFRCGRHSVPLEGLGRDTDGTIVNFPQEGKGSQRIVETSLKGKRRELIRMGVPGTTRDLLVATVREGGSWRFATEGDREYAARVAVEGCDNPMEDFVFHEKKLAVTGQEIVMPQSDKLPPVNRNQRVYYINPTFTEYY